jgi:acetyl-CoA synthase
MSRAISTSAIAGAGEVLRRADKMLAEVIQAKGAEHPVGFPDTAYYLPIIYSFTGKKVEKLGDLVGILQDCHNLLPEPPSQEAWLPYLGDTLDAGVATLFAFEAIEACKILLGPDPTDGIWLGAASDVIMRERGVEFVDGTTPGFAAVIGAAPDAETATKIARELQEKNLYVFMAGGAGGTSFAEQLDSEGVQLGWETRLVPFGRDVSAAIHALGFANRAALAFGGVAPGDFERNLLYNRHRIFAFVLALGEVDDEKYAAAAGAINYGFPTIADTEIPEILPTGICTYEHVVSNVPHDKIVEKALEVRGCKVKVTNVPIPVPYGAAFEGERIRKADVHVQMGGNITPAFEFVTSVDLDSIQDGRIEIIGPDIDEVDEGASLPLAIWVEVAGRKMQSDFEPILERQIHYVLNCAEGLWHMGQREIVWTRISKAGFAKGLRLEHYGKIIHARFLSSYPSLVDKVNVTLITDEAEVTRRMGHAREVYTERDKRLSSMTDESVDTFYSCLLCQSFAPNHVCVISPERLGLCGAYNWLDGRAAHEIDETGPNQPVPKGRCLDPVRGIWEGVNEYAYKSSNKSITTFSAYSIMSHPMTSCGCFEAIAAFVPECNGVMVVNREFQDDTPVGMTFSSLAGSVGGGVQTPGFVGIGKAFVASRKFLAAEGGIRRLVWMPKELKATIGEDLRARAEEEGIPDLLDRIPDETVATAPDELRKALERLEHPALGMDDMASLWDGAAGAAVEHEPSEEPTSTEVSPSAARPPSGRAPSPGPAPAAPPATPEAAAPTQQFSDMVTQMTESIASQVREKLVDELSAELKKSLLAELKSSLLADWRNEEPRAGAEAASEAGGASGIADPVAPESPPAPSPRPGRCVREKLVGITAFTVPREEPGEVIGCVRIGATADEGGTRRRTLVLGGQNCLAGHHLDGVIPNGTAFALEVFDTPGRKLSPVLREVWDGLLERPAEMAKKCVEEYGADAISVSLESTHAEKGARSPDEAVVLVKEVLAAVEVPIIVTAHNHFETANEAMRAVAAACEGERLLLNWVENDNYRTIAGAALAYGHCVVSQSPIDVNLAKQLNILLMNMDLPRDRIVMDPMAGALGYGVEYTYSVMERIRLAGFGGDSALTFPMIACVGQEAWKTKEGNAPESDFPEWGDRTKRGILWEVQTAMPLIMSGADLVVVHHPESLAALRRNVARIRAYGTETQS